MRPARFFQDGGNYLPKEIKTKTSIKDIRVLDKAVSGKAHVKNAFVKSKDTAEGTQQATHSNAENYASDKMEGGIKSVSQSGLNRFRHPRRKVTDNVNKAKKQFQKARQQMPKARKEAAQKAKQTADQARKNADTLKKTADTTKKTAQDAQKAYNQAKQTAHHVKQTGRQTVRTAKQGVRTARQAEKTIKTSAKTAKATGKGTIKVVKKSVKTAERTAKVTVKTAQKTAKAAQQSAKAAAKAAKLAAQASKAAAKAAVQAAKVAVKVTIAMVKAVIAAIKGLIAAIAAGGWVAVVIILVICLVALLIGSIFGIFFSSEPSPDTGQTINSVITEIDNDYTAEIDEIVSANAHDLLDMSGARASWKQVLAIYTVRTVSDPDNPMEVATMDDTKAAILRTVFWEMNTVTHTLDQVEVEEDELGDDGQPTGEKVKVSKTVLRITVTHKTIEEMAAQYGFSNEQKEWLAELLKPEYNSLWNGLLYGITSVGNGSMIEIAETQLGNVGGEPYWSWYGFSSREAWCACFVSWCAEQCGYIDAGIIPKFASCQDGIEWFKTKGQWRDNGYTPATGDLIFYDWDGDGVSDHVGIVAYVDGGYVHTIEGNTSDSDGRTYDTCSRRIRSMGSTVMGYGVPLY